MDSLSDLGKDDLSPAVWEVHVDRALRAPDPVILRVVLLLRVKAFGDGRAVGRNALVGSIDDFVLPLDS